MAKENKIIKYNLEDEAKQLRDYGYSYDKIAKTLAESHPKILDIQKLSPMSVMRFFETYEEMKVQEKVEEGENPVADLTEEFRTAVRDINQRTEKIYHRAIRLLDNLETDNKDSALILKAIKEARDSLGEERKNMIALKQFGEKKAMAIQNVNLKKEIHVKNMLMTFSKDLNKELCPVCRAKMVNVLEKLEE